jgi:alpha-amylase
MYARMMQISQRLQIAKVGLEDSTHPTDSANSELDPDQPARQELYRAQCNCPWWHGAFGGLYLPHLRNAAYQHLIAADNALLEIENRDPNWVQAEQADWDFDGQDEVCLTNNRLAAFFKPDRGGCLYELDLRAICHNLLATLSRRPEAYHETILRHAQGGGQGQGAESIHDRVVFKQAGLDRLLHNDPYLRKSLIDHFYEPGQKLEDLTALKETELGDFVTGVYECELTRPPKSLKTSDSAFTGVQATFRRSGQAGGAPVRIQKVVFLAPTADTLNIIYRLENLPKDHALHFAVEFNFAGMAAGADDRYFYHDGQARAGQLQTLQNLPQADRIGLVDEWLGLDVSLRLSRASGFWAFPIQTVSQSEGGFELVHQSTAVLPHWQIEADSDGCWEVAIKLNLDVSKAEERRMAAVAHA